jgi:hypothetical protein
MDSIRTLMISLLVQKLNKDIDIKTWKDGSMRNTLLIKFYVSVALPPLVECCIVADRILMQSL